MEVDDDDGDEDEMASCYHFNESYYHYSFPDALFDLMLYSLLYPQSKPSK